MSSLLATKPSIPNNNLIGSLKEHLLDVEEDTGGYHTNTKPKFQIRNLTKVSDAGVQILKGITINIPKGVIVGVIGPSRSRKSTLLRALNRLWEPPSSTVYLDGRNIIDLDVLSLRRKIQRGLRFKIWEKDEGGR
ncbi:hypothetical protein RIF29_35644 [Crotalaria pallida]|uniref:ABC transporter domain-containing protein n=1 Tax=Crotalaria pallida TaxID=3830 RepID=A0AAN9HTW8_CROPI